VKDYVGFIDTDLEIPADAMLALYATALEQRADMVLVERVYEWDLHPMHALRHIGSFGLRVFSSMMLGLGRLDTETGAKLFRRQSVLDILEEVSNKGWFWDTEIVCQALRHSQKVVQVTAGVSRRKGKSSSVHLMTDTLTYIKAAVSYKWKRGVRERARDG